eukprot:13373-Heterococcus_DN1.PRE.3
MAPSPTTSDCANTTTAVVAAVNVVALCQHQLNTAVYLSYMSNSFDLQEIAPYTTTTTTDSQQCIPQQQQQQ